MMQFGIAWRSPACLLWAQLLMLAAGGATATDVIDSGRVRLREAASKAESTAHPPTLEREAFLHASSILDVKLSPKGSDIALIRRVQDRLEAKLIVLPDHKETRLMASAGSLEVNWAPDGAGLWLHDDHGVSWFDGASRVTKRVFRWPEFRNMSFFGVDRNAPQHALLRESPGPGSPDPFKYWLLTSNGRITLLYESEVALSGILLRPGPALAFTARLDQTSFDTVILRHGQSDQREIVRCRGLEVCRLIGASPDGKRLWLMGQRGEDLLALQSWRSDDARLTSVHRDPLNRADLDALIWFSEGPVAVAYDNGRREWQALDRSLVQPLKALQGQLPNAALQVSMSLDGRTWLVRAEQELWAEDRFYIYRPDSERLDRLFADQSITSPSDKDLSPLTHFHYRSAEGMIIQGYVLLPKGRELREAPLVAWLHGGPVTRDYARFDARLQFLANRGYVVFVPNFRGSDGFGIQYKLAADGDVGDGRVLSDVLSGLDALIDEGIGSRTKQAVMGHSFGGYLSLVAATHRPDRFSVVFAAAPPTDYGWMKEWQAKHDDTPTRFGAVPLSVVFPLHRYPYLESAWRDKMRRESPRENITKLRSPVYLWSGARDHRVPLASLGHYSGELRRAKKSIVMLTDPEAGHSTNDRLGAEAYLYMMEIAANRSFGGPVVPASETLRAYLRRNTRLGSELLLPNGNSEPKAATAPGVDRL